MRNSTVLRTCDAMAGTAQINNHTCIELIFQEAPISKALESDANHRQRANIKA